MTVILSLEVRRKHRYNQRLSNGAHVRNLMITQQIQCTIWPSGIET
jgi:hypothetical protein